MSGSILTWIEVSIERVQDMSWEKNVKKKRGRKKSEGENKNGGEEKSEGSKKYEGGGFRRHPLLTYYIFRVSCPMDFFLPPLLCLNLLLSSSLSFSSSHSLSLSLYVVSLFDPIVCAWVREEFLWNLLSSKKEPSLEPALFFWTWSQESLLCHTLSRKS